MTSRRIYDNVIENGDEAFNKRRKDIARDFRTNERIRAREIRLVGEGGENTLMFTRDALALARQRGLDLVEVAPNEHPPVCKIMDYGKFRYEQTKKERDSRKTQKQVTLKEVRLSPKIDEHDVATKARMARRFLDEGDKVKLTVRFRGRELAHTNLGRDVLDHIMLMLGDGLIVEAPARMEGKSMTMVVSLKPPKGGVRPPRPAAQPAADTSAENGATEPQGQEATPLPAVAAGSSG